jgi:hypothetical protein
MGSIVSGGSRPDGHRNHCLRRRRRVILLRNAAGLTHTGAGLQERDFAAGQAAVMDEILAQGTAGPAAAEKRLIAVELFLTDRANPGFNPQQHRLPLPTSVSNTHATKYSEGARREARGVRVNLFSELCHFNQPLRLLANCVQTNGYVENKFTVQGASPTLFDTPKGVCYPPRGLAPIPKQAEPP